MADSYASAWLSAISCIMEKRIVRMDKKENHKLKNLIEKQLPKEKKLNEAPEAVIAKAVSHMMKKDQIELGKE